MTSRRSRIRQWLGAVLASLIVVIVLADAVGATSETLPPAATGASMEVATFDQTGMPAYIGPYGEDPYRRDDTYVFAATRSLREGGIHPVMAVILAPAAIVLDTVFCPFAVLLESLARAR